MSRTAGIYTAPASSWNPAVNGASATLADWNALVTDLSNALTQSMSLDGQSTPTGNLPMGNFRLTNLGGAVSTTDATNKADVNTLIAAIAPPRGYIAGLNLSTAGSSSTFSVAAGSAADSTTTAMLTLASSLNKTTSAWAVGTGNGGLDTGAVANSTWYHVYLIRRTDSGVVDAIFSLSASAPTLPASYTQYRRVGSMKTDGSAKWTKFIQDGGYFQWDVSTGDIGVTNPGTAAVSRTLSVPTGVSVRAQLRATIYILSTSGVSNAAALLSDLAITDAAPSLGLTNFSVLAGRQAADNFGTAELQVRTNTSAQIRSRLSASDANVQFYASTIGWFDSRGADA